MTTPWTKIVRRLSLDALEEHKAYKAAITASTSLATAIGEAMQDDAAGFIIHNDDSSTTLYIQFDGTDATANAFPIPAGSQYFVKGTETMLANVRLYAASSVDARIIQLTAID